MKNVNCHRLIVHLLFIYTSIVISLQRHFFMIYTDTVFYHKSEENPHDAPIIPSPRLVPSASVFISHLLTLIQDDNEAGCEGIWECFEKSPLRKYYDRYNYIPQLFRASHSKHSPGGRGINGVRPGGGNNDIILVYF